MAAQDISTTRKTVPPTFAVQRAGGGKARIIALHTRLAATEAVTVTTVGDIETAKRIAHLLEIAWNSSYGRFDTHDRRLEDLAGLPETVIRAIDDGLIGCPPPGDRSRDKLRDALDKARLVADFGPAHTNCRDMDNGADDDDEDCEALLTPRQALRLKGHLDVLGDSFADELRTNAPLDSLIDHAELIDAEDLPIDSQTKEWWCTFQTAFFDLAADIEAGGNPDPATFAEIVALHKALLLAQEDDAGDERGSIGAWVWGERELPEYGCDTYGWHDEMLLSELFNGLLPGNDLIDCVENGIDFYDLVPVERWHHPLPGQPQRDPARLLE
jgi:hypothetical protein